MENTQIVIVGAGPAGLMSALLLARSGIRVTIIERHPSTSFHPKARGLNLRTMEILRSLGLEQIVLNAGADLARNKFMLFVETLAGREIRRIPDDDLMMQGERLRHWTPCTWTQCSQDQLERVLAKGAREAGAEIRFSSEITGLAQNDSSVTCTVRDLASGCGYVLQADYLLACDGSNSFVRRTLNIPLEGRSAIDHFVNIYFRADLKHLVEGRWFGICFVENPEIRALFLPVDNDSRWLLNVQFDPGTTSQSSFDTERCLALVRAAIGDPMLHVEILSAMPWQASALVAPRLRDGRVFLVGDSAHIMPPPGAFGLNTAVQDAHNLAWKLAAVLKDGAGEALLDSYEQERLPIAAALAHEAERQMDAPNPWDSDAQGQPPQIDRPGPDWASDLNDEHQPLGEASGPNPWDQPFEGQVCTVIGFQYRSDAVAQGGTVHGLDLHCQPGTRFSHAWLPDGRSTLDLLTPNFTVVLAEGAELPSPIPSRVQLCQLPATVWTELTQLGAEDAVLVRPDGIVAAQCHPEQISSALRVLTAATKPVPEPQVIQSR